MWKDREGASRPGERADSDRTVAGAGGVAAVVDMWIRISLMLKHLSYGNGSLHVDAAFQEILWSVAPISSGSEAAQGYLIGSDVLRLLHGHMDECLTVPSGEHGEEQRRSVHYEVGAVSVHAHSLWRLETLRVAKLQCEKILASQYS
ncbi:ryanodine receptor 2-like [Camelus bactrianus]